VWLLHLRCFSLYIAGTGVWLAVLLLPSAALHVSSEGLNNDVQC
jgi:hypothetical protein